jgi:hypothetical protein
MCTNLYYLSRLQSFDNYTTRKAKICKIYNYTELTLKTTYKN